MNLRLKGKIISEYGSQWRFCRAINAPESEVSKVIRGIKLLSPKDEIIWSKALKVNPGELFNNETMGH